MKLLKQAKKRMPVEGLNSIEYTLLQTDVQKLYTRFLVYYDKDKLLDKMNKTQI